MSKTIRLGVIVWLATTALTALSASAEDLLTKTRELYQAAMAAYQAEDYPTYASTMKELAALRPDHPTVLYNTASACAVNGEPERAVHWMRTFAEMGLVASPGEDEDFQSLSENAAWNSVLATIEANRQPVGKSEVAFSVETEPDLLPEGVALDSKTGDFFVSSVRKRKVLRVSKGVVSEFRATGADGLWSVFSLAVDSERRQLWVCTAAMAQTPDATEEEVGRSGVLVYDLESGALTRKVILPEDEQNHILNDLALGLDGTAYLTDNQGGKIYILRPKGERFEELENDAVMRSPQGIVLSPDESHLFVADYSTGVHRIEIQSGKSRSLSPIDSTSLIGIDGLTGHGTQLIAIQNGVRPHRILRIDLAEGGDAISHVDVLEANNPDFDEPTLGVVSDGWFYYVANSQWGSLAEDGGVTEGYELSAPTVRKLRL